VDLLLQAMETRAGKVQVATLRQVAPRAADKLLEARLLVATGRIPVVAAMDAYEDEPIPAEWCPERGQYGYRDSVGRWITVEAAEIAACAVDYPLAFARMLVAFERAGPSRPSSLIDGFVWDVGTIRLTGTKSPVPVWFARRLSDPAVWTRLDALLERRPPEEVRVILTSTPERSHPGHDTQQAERPRRAWPTCSAHPGQAGDLAAGHLVRTRLSGAASSAGSRSTTRRNAGSSGFTDKRIPDLPAETKQRQILLQILFAAYWSKSQTCPCASAVGARRRPCAIASTKVNDPRSRAFGRRKRLAATSSAFAEGNCWIEVPD
jgi:hypothetical protein